jgi:hypothetical protein
MAFDPTIMLNGDSERSEKKKNAFYILGKAILMASMQFAIGSVEMSSKFSVKNFSKDQRTLDNAVKALKDYMLIGTLWTIGTSMIFYVNYGFKGLMMNIIANASIMLWIYMSYYAAFNESVNLFRVENPSLPQLVVRGIFEL